MPETNAPALRYRVELFTDAALCWFAQIDSYHGITHSTEFTKRHETWKDAMREATEIITANRK